MSAAVRLTACGPGTSVQDAGRFGLRRYGIAWAGAADRLALALANVLVGNAAEAAAIEMTLAPACLVVEAGPVRLACVGAPLRVDGRRVQDACALDLPTGARVATGTVRDGVHAYLALSGGVRTPPEMGSRAMHLRSGLGGGALAAGALLPCTPPPSTPAPCLAAPLPRQAGPIRILPGPQADLLGREAWASLLVQTWRVDPRSDRMGLRVSGEALHHRGPVEIVSDGVLPGAVQVPGDGQPIVLMRDCQTTGGYPKLACVISADLDRLSRLRPGAALHFAQVTPEAAQAAARDLAALIRGLPSRLRAAGPDPVRLMSDNLISGVRDARDPPKG